MVSVNVSVPRSAVFFKGEEDSATAVQRREAIRHCLAGSAPVITVDLGETTFLDASAVGDLIYLAEMLGKRERQLEVRRCSRDIHKLLQMAGLGMNGSVHFTDHAASQRVLKRQSV